MKGKDFRVTQPPRVKPVSKICCGVKAGLNKTRSLQARAVEDMISIVFEMSSLREGLSEVSSTCIVWRSHYGSSSGAQERAMLNDFLQIDSATEARPQIACLDGVGWSGVYGGRSQRTVVARPSSAVMYQVGNDLVIQRSMILQRVVLDLQRVRFHFVQELRPRQHTSGSSNHEIPRCLSGRWNPAIGQAFKASNVVVLQLDMRSGISGALKEAARHLITSIIHGYGSGYDTCLTCCEYSARRSHALDGPVSARTKGFRLKSRCSLLELRVASKDLTPAKRHQRSWAVSFQRDLLLLVVAIVSLGSQFFQASTEDLMPVCPDRSQDFTVSCRSLWRMVDRDDGPIISTGSMALSDTKLELRALSWERTYLVRWRCMALNVTFGLRAAKDAFWSGQNGSLGPQEEGIRCFGPNQSTGARKHSPQHPARQSSKTSSTSSAAERRPITRPSRIMNHKIPPPAPSQMLANTTVQNPIAQLFVIHIPFTSRAVHPTLWRTGPALTFTGVQESSCKGNGKAGVGRRSAVCLDTLDRFDCHRGKRRAVWNARILAGGRFLIRTVLANLLKVLLLSAIFLRFRVNYCPGTYMTFAARTLSRSWSGSGLHTRRAASHFVFTTSSTLVPPCAFKNVAKMTFSLSFQTQGIDISLGDPVHSQLRSNIDRIEIARSTVTAMRLYQDPIDQRSAILVVLGERPSINKHEHYLQGKPPQMSHTIRLTSDPHRSVKQTAQEGLLSNSDPNPPPPKLLTEHPFPHTSAKISLALTPHHRNPDSPLSTNSPILLPRTFHQIYVRRQQESIWYWVHVPNFTIADLVDSVSSGGNSRTVIEDDLRDVPLSRIRSRLGILEEGDLRFALYEDLEG
ncbi:uncharacterized protein MYCFIDRAFT_175509 [Pseudocercospora fijiensis CIRAD86]|uniref:Uncharacterized protein n=1 Tax=Pseudocercospora fijiensis (strain CIRAD86) TaxID=383855 RepID=M3ABG9_PSEFD|nr:uncharacterized protein MYCFIDRAFT_175509 [Pseudocercospora fijiensis CIRAD86]EME81931.1 hypothetical protein MYCFIDRAFT_175509 [Pseudocercospora fijiensis CIRAD86]